MFRQSGHRFADKNMRQTTNFRAGPDSEGTGRALVAVAGGDLAGDLRALVEIAADNEIGRRSADPVGLLISTIATIEACHHPVAPLAVRRLGLDQGLHLVAPFHAFIGAAEAPQIVERSKNLGEPPQVAVEWCAAAFCRSSQGGERKNETDGDQKTLGHCATGPEHFRQTDADLPGTPSTGSGARDMRREILARNPPGHQWAASR